MKILYLNFAAPTDNATNNSIPRILAKYQKQDQASRMNRFSAWWWGASVLERVDCFASVAEHQRYLDTPLGRDPGSLAAYEQARGQVRGFFLRHPQCSKIMVGMHGLYDDTTYGYSQPQHDAPRVSYDKASDIVLSFLRDHVGSRPISLSLVMCYGARSAQFDVSHDPDRLGGVAGPDLSSAFAFKFYAGLCKYLNVKMSARTGAASFDDTTGASRVESELTLGHRIQMTRNPFTPQEQAQLDAQSQLELDMFMQDLQPQAVNPFNMDQIKAADRQGDAFAQDQLVTLQGADPLTRAKREAAWSRYSQLPQSKPKKSGKLTYEYDPGTHQVVIKSKYPEPRVVQRVRI
ncbi:hypothetical protein G4177_15145 [Corallococcus sp. ZKHCc1 1396]|uniref:Uncharacterized protein n=1 Tax=Corallococcus soli TaxID=2710757 RepID=A0ABR9PNQ9_9BACT|nr:hypothetical protein [Corallococcus soli]MBE4749499.1 hypothetical protein [Corallococcus soli]